MRTVRLDEHTPRIWTPDCGRHVVKLASDRDIARALGLAPRISGGALEVFTQGETINLKNWFNVTPAQDLRVKLFTNNHTPLESDTEAQYTEMGAVQSYVAVDLTPGSWIFSGSSPLTAAYPQIVWTFTAGGPTVIYGYFVIQQSSGFGLWAESFSTSGGPFTVQNNGEQIKVALAMTID